jgi:hypothetical protein
MFLAIAPTVHTTGINWASVTAIVGGCVVILSFIMGIVSKYLGNRITGSIDRFRIDVVNQLDSRLTKVEEQLNAIRNKGAERRR